MLTKRTLPLIPIILLFCFGLASCSQSGQVSQATSTALPTPTEEPMAIRVNGEGISVVEYQAELNRIQMADKELGITTDEKSQKESVQNELITQVLLAQGASTKNYAINDVALQKQIDDLASQIGGTDKLKDWQNKYGYDEAHFRIALQRDMAAAWMRDQIASSVGDTADQVHARQIRVDDEATAQTIQQQIKSGVDFGTLVSKYDPLTQGDLGWFPHGYLYQTAVDDASFKLQVGEVSDMIKTDIGYHFVQVTEKDANHPLSPDAKLFLQHKAVDNWLKQQRDSAKIELIAP